MTVIYVPVKIESAEQAEALPQDTVATHDEDWPRIKDGALWQTSVEYSTAADMVGWTALVRIEAEEEVVEKSRLCQKDPDVLHRYVTGWQPYTAKEQNR